jgi:hypothetical protein
MQPENEGDVERLPSFITGGQPQQSPQPGQGQNGPHGQNSSNGQNGYDGPDRFPLHRRRRRHRGGPRDHNMDHSGNVDPAMPGDGGDGPQSTDE